MVKRRKKKNHPAPEFCKCLYQREQAFRLCCNMDFIYCLYVFIIKTHIYAWKRSAACHFFESILLYLKHSSLRFKLNGSTGGWWGLCGAQRGWLRAGEGRESRPGHPGPVWRYLGDCSLSCWALTLWTAINRISAPVCMLDFILRTVEGWFSLTTFWNVTG